MERSATTRRRSLALSGVGLRRLAPVLPFAGLVALVALAYGPAVPNFFVSDDLDMLSGDASDLFSPTSGFGRFMPLAAAVHRAQAAVFGLNPVPAHALQVVLHAASVLLVYALARQLTALRSSRDGTTGVALAAAVLFALYPRHHQVVMWFGAVSIGLAATLALATAVLFGRAWRERDARAGWATVATYTAALLAHESAVVLPLLLLALALYCTATGPRRGRAALPALPAWLWALPLISAAHLALLGWAYQVRAATYPDSGYRFLGLGTDLAAAPLRYAAQLVAPPPWTENLTLGAVGLALGGLALVGLAAWAWRGGALTRLGLAWAALAGAPFVAFGIYGVTDRYYYLPSAGLALAAAVALARLGRGRGPLLAAYGAVAVVLLAQVGGEWRLAGARVRGTMDALAAWAAAPHATPPEAVAFVGVPFKRGERWPGSQVYVFSTGLVGAAHLATGWPTLRVSYVFADEHPALGAWLAALPPAPGPPGLALFALDPEPPADHTAALGAALPELARLRWRGASRTPIEWARYAAGAFAGEERPPGGAVSGR